MTFNVKKTKSSKNSSKKPIDEKTPDDRNDVQKVGDGLSRGVFFVDGLWRGVFCVFFYKHGDLRQI